MELTIKQKLHGFVVQKAEDLPEIDGRAYVLFHEKSGARLLYLQNSDINKAFSISFRTPPADDTGVFHILEHSVLCGSDKFPVKEPFVNLLKSSMQTFLNAMTFPDKTMYPVASTNDQDLINLADVYLDAVLHPMIYHKRTIFEQEGWHYEVVGSDKSHEATGAFCKNKENLNDNQKLAFNGVVFNEMKGALSDPNSVLYDALQSSLFPDTAYCFESGGIPCAIPDLTYEQFLEEHTRHYRLDNSYLTLYGNVNLDAMLEFLDERYLSVVADEQLTCDKKRASLGEAPLKPRTLEIQKPVRAMGVRQTMATAPENACAGIGYVVGHARERTRMIAVDILMDAIAGSNEAPLKRAFLDAGLADDAHAFLADSVLQPFVVIQLRGLSDGAAERFVGVVEKTMTDLANGGLDRELLEAAISRAEFVMRESDFGMADGVALSMSALAGWLYDDDLAISYLRFEDDFAFLRDALNEGYFENLIKSVFLQNDHMAQVEIVPVPGDAESWEAEKLAEKTASMSPEDFAHIEKDVAQLRLAQEEPDTPEQLATLPRLSVEDIEKTIKEPSYGLAENTPVPCLRHKASARGISYVYQYFNLDCVSFEELPYVAVLGLVLGKLGTSQHSAAELDVLTHGKLGNLGFFAEVSEDTLDPQGFVPRFVVSASALSENTEYLVSLPEEVMCLTDFADKDKIKSILQQRRISMEQSFAAAGHASAMMRLSSYYLPAGVVREQLGGVDFYWFLKDVLDNYISRADELQKRLSNLATRIFTDENIVISFSGSDTCFNQFWSSRRSLGRGSTGQALLVPTPVVRNEAFIVPSDVCYAAQGFDRRSLSADYDGAWQVAAKALSYDYLWNEVRVKGGAYGAGFQTARSGNLRFYSYRDPRLDETLERFAHAADWLASFNPDSEEMEGYVVSTVAGFDTPLKTRTLVRRQATDWLNGRTLKDRNKTRSQMLAANVAKLHGFADTIAAAVDKRAVCAFGSKDIINQSQADLSMIELLGAE